MDEYQLKVPQGSADLVRARLEEATEDLASLNYLTVKKGETLATIARKLKVSRTDLAEANYPEALMMIVSFATGIPEPRAWRLVSSGDTWTLEEVPIQPTG